MGRFAESFQSLHSAKLQAAEKKSVEMFMNGDMPAARGKKKRKPMTEVGFVEIRPFDAGARLRDGSISRAVQWFAGVGDDSTKECHTVPSVYPLMLADRYVSSSEMVS